MNKRSNTESNPYPLDKKCIVECDIKKSDKCMNTYSMGIYEATTTVKQDEQFCCPKCFEYQKKNYDTSIMETIDTEEKAYLLGLVIGSGMYFTKDNGDIGFGMYFKKDNGGDINYHIECLICKDFFKHTASIFNNLRSTSSSYSPLVIGRNTQYDDLGNKTEHTLIVIRNDKVVLDILNKHLKLDVTGPMGAQRRCFGGNFPDIKDYDLKKVVIRGIFDSMGYIDTNSVYYDKSYKSLRAIIPHCASFHILESIKSIIGIPCEIIRINDVIGTLCYSGSNAMDFLSVIYNTQTTKTFKYVNNSKYEQFRSLVYINDRDCDTCVFTKTLDNAVVPSKPHFTDSGFDLTVVEKIKTVGDVEFYDTGIAIAPPIGFWTMVVPRSSISKTGYMLANSVGIIDNEYRGSLVIALRKIDKDADDIVLPCRIAQLIFQPAIYPRLVQVDNLDETSRNTGGFGSSNK